MEILYSISNTAAVKLSENVIIAGIGRSVYVFSLKTKVLLKVREVLTTQNVRDLAFNSDHHVLVYGGKEIGLFKLIVKEINADITELFLWEADDWIVYSKWLEFNEIATLSAHNVVTVWSCKGQKKFQLKCEQQSILYSGYIVGDSCHDLICFAGTVFGQVAIWSVKRENSESLCRVMHYLRGHKGAIFSVRYDTGSNLICTTSDDRSVRWWLRSPPSGEGTSPSSLDESWSASQVQMVSIGYGHLSRVWKCFVTQSYTFTAGEDSQICVWKNLEVQELYQNDGCEQREFPLIARKQILQGGSIWDLDFNLNYGILALGLEDGGILLWTLDSLVSQRHISSHSPLGNHDPTRRVCLFGKELQPVIVTRSGSIVIKEKTTDNVITWKTAFKKTYLGLCLLESSNDKKSIAVTSSDGSLDILSGCSVPSAGEDIKIVAGVKLDGDYVLSLHWLANDFLLTCRSGGQLQLWVVLQNEDGIKTLKEIAKWVLPYSKQRWTTAAAWIPWGKQPGLVLCGNRSGDLLVYSMDHPDPIQIIHHLHGQMGVTSLVVSWPKSDDYKHWTPTYHESYLQSDEPCMKDISECLFNVEIYSTGRDGILNIFVIRNGALQIKGSDKLGFEWAAQCLLINQKVLVFGFKGACAVIWGIKERCILLEKNCGGGHRSWDIDYNLQSDGSLDFLLAMVKHGELTLVDWKMPPESLSSNIVQNGLHSKEVNCVCCFNWSQCFGNHFNGLSFMITGSEDTSVKVSTFSPLNAERTSMVSNISTLHGHLSSVRTVSILPLFSSNQRGVCDVNDDVFSAVTKSSIKESGTVNGSHDFIVFSAGGRAQLKAWKLSFDQAEKYLSVSSTPESCRVEEKFSLMLDHKRKNSAEIQNNLESRLMHIHSFYPSKKSPEKSSNKILVAVLAACSDGLLRLFGYKESENNQSEIASNCSLGLWSHGIPYPNLPKRHCLFKALHCLFHGRHTIITTDCIGFYHLWDVTSEVELLAMTCEHLDKSCACPREKEPFSPFFRHLSHQFSINAVDWMEMTSHAVKGLRAEKPDCKNLPLLLIATGGEDGALALDLLELCWDISGKNWNGALIQASCHLEGAAATQIAGVKFVQNNYLITVSKCQQLILWKWLFNVEDSSLCVSRVSHCSVTIPDIQDIDVIETRDGVYAVICGCGLEVVYIVVPNEEIK